MGALLAFEAQKFVPDTFCATRHFLRYPALFALPLGTRKGIIKTNFITDSIPYCHSVISKQIINTYRHLFICVGIGARITSFDYYRKIGTI